MLRQLLSGRTNPAAGYDDPRAYWEQRHRTHGDSLRAPGHRLLDEQQNAAQYDLKRHELKRILLEHLGDACGRTLLDAGCGTGAMLPLFTEMGFHVVGVDFSQSAIDAAQQHNANVEFAVAPLSTLCLDRRFDAILAVDVLLHIVDDVEWRAALESLCLHLCPSGHLVILDCLNVPGNAAHVRPRTKVEYTQELQRRNVRLVDHQQFYLPHEKSTKDILVARRHNGML